MGLRIRGMMNVEDADRALSREEIAGMEAVDTRPYIIISEPCDSIYGSHHETLSRLETQVNEHIECGYKPCGGLITDRYSGEFEGGTIFVQAMVKKEV